MKLFQRRKKTNNADNLQKSDVITELRDKLEVEILGKGSQSVTVDKSTTIKDVRDILNVDSNVQAIDEKGRRISDDRKVMYGSSGSSSGKKVSFIPNVKADAKVYDRKSRNTWLQTN